MPLAVWTSSLSGDLASIKRAVSTDVSFTHPSKTVQTAILIYHSVIHVLLNNPSDTRRAEKAYALALEIAIAEEKDSEKKIV